jgi:hypothetical protein
MSLTIGIIITVLVTIIASISLISFGEKQKIRILTSIGISALVMVSLILLIESGIIYYLIHLWDVYISPIWNYKILS